MELTALWDTHTLIYVLLSATVILVILAVLSTTNRRLRNLTSDVESLRREMKLVDEGVQSVARHLQTIRPELALGDDTNASEAQSPG